MKKILITLLLTSSCCAHPQDIIRVNSSAIKTHPSLGNMCVSHNGEVFTVYHRGRATNVAPHDVDPQLRYRSKKEIEAFLKVGSLKINQYSNGDYKIDGALPVNGGGPGLANFGYFLIKGVGYTLPVVVTVTAFTQGVDVPPAFQFVGKVAGKFLNKKAVEVITQAATDTGGKTAAKLGGDISKVIVKEAGTKVSGEIVGSMATTSGGYFAAVETIANGAYLVLLAVPGW